MDWREVARERRIPVWPGACVWWDSEDGDGAVTAGLWVVVGQNGPEWLLARAEGESVRAGVSVRPGALVLALDHPDTRAAYDRRLALELGCPAHTADCGVVVGWSRGLLTVWAGIPDTGAEPGDIVWLFERAVPVPKDADRLAARALAWPKEGS